MQLRSTVYAVCECKKSPTSLWCLLGARVVMACRDLLRAEKAAEEIRCSTGNGNIVVRHLDLASFTSIRQFAQEYIATEGRLDILINNAGETIQVMKYVCIIMINKTEILNVCAIYKS